MQSCAPMQTLDVYHRQLTKAGYLSDTEKPGIYKIKKPIPKRLTTSKLKFESYGYVREKMK